MSLPNPKAFYLRGLAWLLVAAFLYGQWAYNQHHTDVAQHLPDHACEWCLTHGQVGGAMVNTAATHVSDTTSVFLQEKHRADHGRAFFHSYGARAPPVLLHI